MVDMARIWPILCQFGIGAVLCWIGIRAGITSGYLDFGLREHRRLMVVLAGGFAALLLLYCAFTFWLPFTGGKATP